MVVATAGRRSLSPSRKKGKVATTSEQARQILADKNCIQDDKHTTPSTLYKTFQGILDRYNTSIPEDLYLTLQAFMALLQESASSEQITKKVIQAVAQRVETQVKATLEKSLSKMSSMVENIVTNQIELQGLASVLSEAMVTLQTLTQDLGNSTREASATSNQLTTTVTSYKEALLSASSKIAQAPQPEMNRASEDPRLTRDLDCKQCQILLELSKEYNRPQGEAQLCISQYHTTATRRDKNSGNQQVEKQQYNHTADVERSYNMVMQARQRICVPQQNR